jgi:uncharacterized protein YaaR (DUF327 family)
VDKIDAGAFFNPLLAGQPRAEAKKPGGKKGLSRIFGGRFEAALQNEWGGGLELGPLGGTAPSEEALARLLDGVHSAGDALRERPLKDEMLAYKRAVRDFLHYVVSNGYDIAKSEGIPQGQKPGYKGRLWEEKARERKSFETVRVVDEKLERLAAGVLAGQVKQTELLSRLEEIRGLLVNLIVKGKVDVD